MYKQNFYSTRFVKKNTWHTATVYELLIVYRETAIVIIRYVLRNNIGHSIRGFQDLADIMAVISFGGRIDKLYYNLKLYRIDRMSDALKLELTTSVVSDDSHCIGRYKPNTNTSLFGISLVINTYHVRVQVDY